MEAGMDFKHSDFGLDEMDNNVSKYFHDKVSNISTNNNLKANIPPNLKGFFHK